MTKKKISKRSIFVVSAIATVLAILVGYIVMKQIFVMKGDKAGEILYKSDNVILQVLEQNKNAQNVVILGEGYSESVNEEGIITHCDPLMLKPNTNLFNQDTQVIYVYYPFDVEKQQERLGIAGKEISSYINKNLKDYEEENIVVIGHSKCGVCFANMAQWLNRKITIVTISAPFKGTIVADKSLFKEKMNYFEFSIYNIMFSNHQIDKDIITGSYFLEQANYDGLANQNHINIVSTCKKKSNNLIDNILAYINDKYSINGDGIVPLESQLMEHENTIQIFIDASHATSTEKGIEVAKQYIPCLQ